MDRAFFSLSRVIALLGSWKTENHVCSGALEMGAGPRAQRELVKDIFARILFFLCLSPNKLVHKNAPLMKHAVLLNFHVILVLCFQEETGKKIAC